MIVSASFLSLFFGGAVGPESGLVSLLLGLCCWAMDQFGLARWKMETLIAGNPYIRKKELFRVMAAGLFLLPDQIVYDKGKISWKRKEQIAAGIQLDDGEIQADAISYTDDFKKDEVGIEIHSGKNRIVRRIFESLGYKVVKLDRVFFAGLTKKGLRRGEWRYLTEQEVNFLRMGSFE